MDAANCSLAAGLVSQSYVSQGAAALGSRRRLVKALLSNRALPAEGWDEATIEMLLQVSGVCMLLHAHARMFVRGLLSAAWGGSEHCVAWSVCWVSVAAATEHRGLVL